MPKGLLSFEETSPPLFQTFLTREVKLKVFPNAQKLLWMLEEEEDRRKVGPHNSDFR